MLKDMAPRPQAGRVEQARKLRRTLSLPEGLLWRELRKRPRGLKFRRQHPSGIYVLDFYCSDARLAIEVDGAAHAFGNRPGRDSARDTWFAEAGIMTMRIAASLVLSGLQDVLDGIVAEAASRVPLHHPAAPGGPPPRDKLGEE
ncbi:MAG TPA: DUF559 domain-containing protein [Novosphingobium sp.]|nr:DUF559 domain-containing protein [Novosphingobium sp.]